MAEEKEKLDIEDIPEPAETGEPEEAKASREDIDIEEAVLEDLDANEDNSEVEGDQENSEKGDVEEIDNTNEIEEAEETEKTKEVIESVETSDNRDVLEKVVEEEEAEQKEIKKAEPKKSNIKLKDKRVKRVGSKNWVKIAVVILITIIITAAAVLGAMYYLNQRNNEETPQEVVQEEMPAEETVTDELASDKDIAYISSAVGLNLRKEADIKSEVLIIIPFGTEIPVLAEEGDWIQTEYDGKTGWVSAEFTQKTNPWVYENEKYGFSLTFDGGWEGYEFFEETIQGIPVFYLGLPTTQTGYLDGSVDSGYASLFAISVYTPSKWNEVKNSEGPKPTLLKETDKYVFVWSSAQARPDDLKTQFDDIKNIIATFKVL